MNSKSSHTVTSTNAKTLRIEGLRSTAILAALVSLCAMLTACTGSTSDEPGTSASKLTELNGVAYACPASCGGSSDVDFSNGKASVTCKDGSGKTLTCNPSGPAKEPPSKDPKPLPPSGKPDQADTDQDDADQGAPDQDDADQGAPDQEQGDNDDSGDGDD